jgi:hypothetical protein
MLNTTIHQFLKIAKEKKNSDVYKDLGAGALAGLAASYATYPIDTVSNVKQTFPAMSIRNIVADKFHEGKQLASEGKLFAKTKLTGYSNSKPIFEHVPSSTIASRLFKKYPKAGGLSHFYGGAGVKIFKVAPYTALSFALYNKLKEKFNASKQN